MSLFAPIVIIFLILNKSVAFIDQTETPQASGSDVVRATIARLDHAFTQTPGSFWNLEHSPFMRILAYVETKYGLDNDTFNTQESNGIWRISQQTFNSLVIYLHTSEGREYTTHINSALNVNKFESNFFFPDYVSKALNSLILARILLHKTENIDGCESIPTTDSTVDQIATFWYNCYRSGMGDMDKEFFKQRYEDFKREGKLDSTSLANPIII